MRAAFPGDFLTVDHIHAEGHAPLAQRAAPEDAALPGIAAVPARYPRDGTRFEAVQILPEHDIERAAQRGAAYGAQAVAAENLDALYGRKRQGFQIAAGGGVRPAVHQDEQRLSPGQEVADDAGIQQFLERLRTRAFDKAPVIRGDNARSRCQRPCIGFFHRRCGEKDKQGERNQENLHRKSNFVSMGAAAATENAMGQVVLSPNTSRIVQKSCTAKRRRSRMKV